MTLVELMQEEGLRLERRGLSWWCSCPFHRDDTPSLRVSQKGGGQVWYCYSCKRGGGPAAFLAEHRNIPEHEARRLWARMNGKEEPDGDRELLTRVVESMRVNGHPYLRGRGITDDTCRLYGVGYCEDYGALLREHGLSEARARELGLFDVSGCMVYPFYDSEGVYKIAARSVEDKRYRNPAEGAKFAREGLWGLHLLRGDVAWVFEGYHDAMMARQHGYQSVAACGTNMHPAMWEELRSRGVTRVIVAPDGDAAGHAWLEKLASEAPQDVCVEFVSLDHGDPDDALEDGTFQGVQPVTPFQWYVSRSRPEDLASKVRQLRDASPVWARMPQYQRALTRVWYASEYGDDEALDWLFVPPGEPDYDSERTVLANCLYSKLVRLETVRELEEWHFNGRLHRSAWVLIRDREATAQMLQVELGLDLSDHADLVNYRFYVDRLRDVGVRSRVSKLLASANPSNVGGLIEELYKVTDRVSVSEASDLAAAVMEDVNVRVADPGIPGVELPSFPTINKMLMGLNPERLILLSGNSGHGKTTLACNMVNDLIDDHETLFVTLEMTDKEITQKLICIRSGIPSAKLVTGSLEQFEYDKVLEAAESVSRSKLQVVYGVNDLYKLVALVRAHAMRRRTRFVVIDYLQLISVPTREERWEQLARITKTLKVQVCQKLGITTLALSQLKRSSLNSDVPDAADQAGAYAMLADADHAITARKMDPKDTKDGSNYLIHLSKNRFGLDSITIPSVFDRNTQRVSEL